MLRRAWWWIAALAGAGLSILGWIVLRGRENPSEIAQRELQAIDAAKKAKVLTANAGAERARAQVQAQYRDQLQGLDAAKRRQAEALKQDPEALARFLVRAGRKR